MHRDIPPRTAPRGRAVPACVELPTDAFTTTVVRGRATFTVTPRMFFSGIAQYNSTARSVGSNLRLRWEYLPGSELFVVYTDDYDSQPPTGIPAEDSPPVPEQAVAVEEPVIEAAPAPPQVLSGAPVTIGVPREVVPGERRVALVPDIVKRLVAQGQQVVVETNAGNIAIRRPTELETATLDDGEEGKDKIVKFVTMLTIEPVDEQELKKLFYEFPGIPAMLFLKSNDLAGIERAEEAKK